MRAAACVYGLLFASLAGRLDGQEATRVDTEFESVVKAAETAKADGQAATAIRLYRKATARQPHWSEGWKNLGILLADQGDYPAARTAFENLAKLEPNRGDAWVLMGICKFRMKEYDAAVADLEKARAFPIFDNTLERLLYYHAALGMILREDFDTAQKRLLLLSRQIPENDQLAEAYGLAALRLAFLPGQEPAELRPAVMEVGRLVARSRRQPAARTKEEFLELVARYSVTRGVQYAYGNFLAAHTYFREACDAFQAELQISPSDAMSHLQIASIESQQFNNDAGALPFAERAVKLAPQLYVSHFVLGRILLKMGRLGEAVSELEAAAKLAPDSVMVHHMLLTAYNKTHRKDAAARQQDILRKLQLFEATWKGKASDPEPPDSTPADPSER